MLICVMLDQVVNCCVATTARACSTCPACSSQACPSLRGAVLSAYASFLDAHFIIILLLLSLSLSRQVSCSFSFVL